MTVQPADSKQSDEDLSKEIAAGVRGLLDRVGEFFHLFDLSFFVSGATNLGAAAYWYSRHAEVGFRVVGATWVRVLMVVVASYVLGLLAFGAGRAMTYLWRSRWFPRALREIAVVHQLEGNIPRSYLEAEDGTWRLYERLWVDLRESRRHAPSFQLLNRYWVMSATYDGVAVASLTWSFVLAAEPLLPAGNWLNAFLPLAALAIAGLCWWQANNYLKYQLREMLATFASSRQRLII